MCLEFVFCEINVPTVMILMVIKNHQQDNNEIITIFILMLTFSGWSAAKPSSAFSTRANRPLRLSSRLVMWPTSCTWVLNLLASCGLATALALSATDTPSASFTVVSSATAICSSRSTFSFLSNRDTRSAWIKKNKNKLIKKRFSPGRSVVVKG